MQVTDNQVQKRILSMARCVSSQQFDTFDPVIVTVLGPPGPELRPLPRPGPPESSYGPSFLKAKAVSL